jgi:hypothetical protein
LDDSNAEFLMDAAYMLFSFKGNDGSLRARVLASRFVSRHPELVENVT